MRRCYTMRTFGSDSKASDTACAGMTAQSAPTSRTRREHCSCPELDSNWTWNASSTGMRSVDDDAADVVVAGNWMDCCSDPCSCRTIAVDGIGSFDRVGHV